MSDSGEPQADTPPPAHKAKPPPPPIKWETDVSTRDRLEPSSLRGAALDVVRTVIHGDTSEIHGDTSDE